MTRKICYITGTRADFGLMQSTLAAIDHARDLELAIVVTGMHLAQQYGQTITDIEAARLPIAARIEVNVEPATGATMARNIGSMLVGFVDSLQTINPDLVLLLGDRGEMLAGALAAIHLNIPVAHIHGGERSGTVDEPVRHAISKLSHFHFTATEEARSRLIRMGEQPDQVWVTGAPGLDGIESLANASRTELMNEIGLDPQRPVALMVYHPVLQEEAAAGDSTTSVLDALLQQNVQIVGLAPNSDAGSHRVRQALEARAGESSVRFATHFSRSRFVSWMAIVDLMIGNSSAGIIEAASFGTPVINVGSRQNLRERNSNVTDVTAERVAIEQAIIRVLTSGRYKPGNVYGDGKTADRIVALLQTVPLDLKILAKTNAY